MTPGDASGGRKSGDAKGDYWFCLEHRVVEERSSGCRNADRLGPYPTREEASRALEIVQERNAAWDDDD